MTITESLEPSIPASKAKAFEDGDSVDAEILKLRETLRSESESLAKRFRALFALKHHASLHPPTAKTYPAIDAIAAAIPTPSALLKHELAYCLGQTRNLAAVPYLRAALEDPNEMVICRHEAAEALGALGDKDSLELLKRVRDAQDENVIVKETCEIAVDRVEWEIKQAQNTEKLHKSNFVSIDPAPPFAKAQQRPSIEVLEKTMMDSSLSLFERYRAIFSLRDLSSPPDLPTAVPAVHALSKGFQDSSALFRHEIAFVFGQLCHPASIPSLYKCLSDTSEMDMVRHEAAEALGSLGDEEGVYEMLQKFIEDKDRVVRESIVVALDMAEFERHEEPDDAFPSNVSTSVAVASS